MVINIVMNGDSRENLEDYSILKPYAIWVYWGHLQIAFSCEIWPWLNSMVYGRYNELVNGVYKPTNISGGHHPVWVYWGLLL
jgi:hypothetical protein